MKPQYDLAGKIIGLAMKVHSTLGAGFLESVYQKAMEHELDKAGIRFVSQKPLKVVYDGCRGKSVFRQNDRIFRIGL
jgi:GxxExxY protein